MALPVQAGVVEPHNLDQVLHPPEGSSLAMVPVAEAPVARTGVNPSRCRYLMVYCVSDNTPIESLHT